MGISSDAIKKIQVQTFALDQTLPWARVCGRNVLICIGARLSSCVLMRSALVKDYSIIRDSIVGWHSTVGRWYPLPPHLNAVRCRLMGIAVLGEDVHIGDEYLVNGGSILPHKSVTRNIMSPEIVM